MKRIGNLYESVYAFDNLLLADKNAGLGKSKQLEVIQHRKKQFSNLERLQVDLMEMTYKTSEYDCFTIYEPKAREISKLPYFPDRICHHAVVNVIGGTLTRSLIANTYSCVVGRGIHKAYYDVVESLKDVEGTQYALKIDIRKYFPSISNDILKNLLRRKLKDQNLLWLLDEIIDSAKGLPIGNYLSGLLANFYLTYFDHWLKEYWRLKYVFRYCDDILILHDDKKFLHTLREEIQLYLWDHLRLELKRNYQVFPVASRGIDFVGYKSYHTHSLLRKGIKKNFVKMIDQNRNEASINSYMGWLGHCDSKNLVSKYI